MSDLDEALAAFRRGDLDRAQDLAEEAVEIGQSAQWQHLLGLILCRRGDPSTGVEWLCRARDAEPGNIGFQVIAARALVDAGRAPEVLAMPEPPPITSPATLALWQARGEAADAAGVNEGAIAAWRTIVAVTPNDWRAWANLGDAHARLDEWRPAADALANAASLNPRDGPLQKRYASALLRAGRPEESMQQFRRMLDGDAGDIESRLTLARLYADGGRHDDALEQLEMAASAEGSNEGLIRVAIPDPASIGHAEIASVRELALLLERTNRMDALGNLLEDARRYGIASEQVAYPSALLAFGEGYAERAKKLLLADESHLDPVRCHALMARIEEQLGNADSAFAEAEAMHAAVADRSDWLRRAADYRQKIERFAATMTEEWVSRLRPLEAPSRSSPAFLIGFPRSGTTLLDTFLRGHPGTRVIEEQHMLNEAEAVIGNFADLPARSPDQLQKARGAYFAELDRHVEPGFEGLVIDKLPLNMLGLPIIHSLFPDARIIFAQRHPCDVVLSCFFQAFAQNDAMACFLDLEDAAAFYDVSMRLFSSSRRLLPLEFHTIGYEELVVDPEATLRPAVDFLGLDWRPGLLDHQATARARGAINTPSYAQVAKPLTKAPAGRWRRYSKQLKPVLPVLLPWAERLGYST